MTFPCRTLDALIASYRQASACPGETTGENVWPDEDDARRWDGIRRKLIDAGPEARVIVADEFVIVRWPDAWSIINTGFSYMHENSAPIAVQFLFNVRTVSPGAKPSESVRLAALVRAGVVDGADLPALCDAAGEQYARDAASYRVADAERVLINAGYKLIPPEAG